MSEHDSQADASDAPSPSSRPLLFPGLAAEGEPSALVGIFTPEDIGADDLRDGLPQGFIVLRPGSWAGVSEIFGSVELRLSLDGHIVDAVMSLAQAFDLRDALIAAIDEAEALVSRHAAEEASASSEGEAPEAAA